MRVLVETQLFEVSQRIEGGRPKRLNFVEGEKKILQTVQVVESLARDVIDLVARQTQQSQLPEILEVVLVHSFD